MKWLVSTVAAVLLICGLMAAPAGAATKTTTQYLQGSEERALTEIDISQAVLRLPGTSKRVRNLASLAVKRGGHELVSVQNIERDLGVASVSHGRRKGTSEVQHLQTASVHERNHSYPKLLLSNLKAHIQAYEKAEANGNHLVSNHAKSWLPHLVDLQDKATALKASLQA